MNYSFDASLLNRERIFQLENKRDDGIWEANFARPQLERFIAASPYIEAAAITNNLVYSSVRFGISASEGPDARSYMEQVERITPGYTKVFGFELVAGRYGLPETSGRDADPREHGPETLRRGKSYREAGLSVGVRRGRRLDYIWA